MIEPKFREVMTRIEGEGFTVRLWWNGSKTKPTCDNQAIGLERRLFEVLLSDYNDADADDVEHELLHLLHFEDGLAAYEILVTETGNGIVGYIEWP